MRRYKEKGCWWRKWRVIVGQRKMDGTAVKLKFHGSSFIVAFS